MHNAGRRLLGAASSMRSGGLAGGCLCGCRFLKSCGGVWPKLEICASMAFLVSRSSIELRSTAPVGEGEGGGGEHITVSVGSDRKMLVDARHASRGGADSCCLCLCVPLPCPALPLTLVGEVVEAVDSLHRLLALLAGAKHEVYPGVQRGADVLRLQGLALDLQGAGCRGWSRAGCGGGGGAGGSLEGLEHNADAR
jgi:hypothetical protein